jgi:hypothetical protein
MTYPDLVPAISGFMEWFFIDVLTLLFSLADGPDVKGRSGLPYRKGSKIAGGEILCPKIPGGKYPKPCMTLLL